MFCFVLFYSIFCSVFVYFFSLDGNFCLFRFLFVKYRIRYSYTVLYYTILYHTILYYIILYYTLLYYTILYYTILYYTILYYTILYCTLHSLVLQHLLSSLHLLYLLLSNSGPKRAIKMACTTILTTLTFSKAGQWC